MSETGETALLPCPFCGGEPTLRQLERDGWELNHKCGALTVFIVYWLKARVITSWNRRASPVITPSPTPESAEVPSDKRLVPVECDAARYRWLREQANLVDYYDHGASNRSHWQWVVEIETGKRGGPSVPPDTPDFDAALDLAISAGKSKAGEKS